MKRKVLSSLLLAITLATTTLSPTFASQLDESTLPEQESSINSFLEQHTNSEEIGEIDFITVDKESCPSTSDISTFATVSDYQLFNVNDIAYFVDDYYSTHGMKYLGIQSNNSTDALAKYVYASNYAYSKSDYMWMEIATASGNTVNYQEHGYWNVSGTKAKYLNYNYNKQKYQNEKYLYITLGVTDSLYSSYYEDSVRFKVQNPLYSDWTSHWANNEIRYAMTKGWVKTTDEFRPDAAITRAEFVKIVNKAFGFTSAVSTESFTDVNDSDWFSHEVKIALKAGYITSKNSSFRPNAPITREEVASIVTTIKNNKDSNLDKLRNYKDFNQVSTWAHSSVEGAIEAGYMGLNSDMFNPKQNITRAQSIVTLYRIVTR